MNRLRILHVVPYYEQAWAYGGIPRLATTMTRALARRGHRVTVCTTDAQDERSRATAAIDHRDDIDVRIFPNVSNRLAYHLQLFTPVGLRSHLRAAAPSFDIAHLHACHNLPVAIAAAELWRAGIPYVVSPNGTARPIERRIIAKRVFAATVGRHVLPRAARVLAVTDAERQQLLALGSADAAIAIVPNPIDDAEFERAPDPAGFRAARQLGTAPIVLFLGKLTPRKGAADLVRAFARLAPTEAMLVIAGNDMGSGADVDALIRDLRLTARVRRIGLLRGYERLDALAAAGVVVYPSRDEIFGLVPLEALLCGTPVIVCGDSGCGEVITHTGGGIIVRHGDVGALHDAIAAILSAPAAWRAAARTAAARARMSFNSEVVCDRLLEVYGDVLDETLTLQRPA